MVCFCNHLAKVIQKEKHQNLAPEVVNLTRNNQANIIRLCSMVTFDYATEMDPVTRQKWDRVCMFVFERTEAYWSQNNQVLQQFSTDGVVFMFVSFDERRLTKKVCVVTFPLFLAR